MKSSSLLITLLLLLSVTSFAQQKIQIVNQFAQLGFDIKLKEQDVALYDAEFIVSGEPVPTAKMQGEQMAMGIVQQKEQMEQQQQMQEAVQTGEMLPERYELEMQKAQELMRAQLEGAEQQYMSELQNEASKIENKVISEKEFKILMTDEGFAENVVGQMRFHANRVKQTCVIGDKLIYEQILPETINLLSPYPSKLILFFLTKKLIFILI